MLLDDATAYEAGRDLVASTFRVVEGLRIRALGLNHYFHWKISVDHSVDPLAPEVRDALARRSADPHVTRIQVKGDRTDDHKGAVGADIQPSVRVQQGFFCSVNDHYDLESYDRDEANERLQEILGTNWDTSGDVALEIATNLVHLVTGSHDEIDSP